MKLSEITNSVSSLNKNSLLDSMQSQANMSDNKDSSKCV